MGVEVDQTDLAAAVGIGDRGGGGIGDRMIAADDDRHDLARGHLGNPDADRLVCLVGHPWIADRVAIVDDVQDVKRRNFEVQVPAGRLIIRHPNGPRTKAGARPVGRAVVPGSADDGDVRMPPVELLGLGQHPDFHEGGWTQVLWPVDLSIEIRCLWHWSFYLRRFRSLRISRDALRPLMPLMPPPGWVPEPQR